MCLKTSNQTELDMFAYKSFGSDSTSVRISAVNLACRIAPECRYHFRDLKTKACEQRQWCSYQYITADSPAE